MITTLGEAMEGKAMAKRSWITGPVTIGICGLSVVLFFLWIGTIVAILAGNSAVALLKQAIIASGFIIMIMVGLGGIIAWNEGE